MTAAGTKKFGRAKLRGEPLLPDCSRARASGVEFRDKQGNAYIGCYGLMDSPDAYNAECRTCGALAHLIDVSRFV